FHSFKSEATMDMLKIGANNSEEASPSRQGTRNIDHHSFGLRIRFHQGSVSPKFQNNTTLPAMLFRTQHVRPYDKTRQQTLGQNGIAVPEIQTLYYIESFRFLWLLLVKEFRYQNPPVFIGEGETKFNLSH